MSVYAIEALPPTGGDDYANLQAAITDAVDNCKLLLPSGHYSLSHPLLAPGSLSMSGVGDGLTTLVVHGFTGPMLQVGGTVAPGYDVNLADFGLDCGNQANVSGLQLLNCRGVATDLRVSRITTGGVGIVIPPAATTAGFVFEGLELKLVRPRLLGVGQTGVAMTAGAVDGLQCIHPTLAGTAQGLMWNGIGGGLIDSPRLADIGGIATELAACTGTVIANVTAINCQGVVFDFLSGNHNQAIGGTMWSPCCLNPNVPAIVLDQGETQSHIEGIHMFARGTTVFAAVQEFNGATNNNVIGGTLGTDGGGSFTRRYVLTPSTTLVDLGH